MGKKSISDVDRMVKWQQDLKKVRALSGPFQCPWCFTDQTLQWTQKEERVYHPNFGPIIKHDIRFYCLECKRTKMTLNYSNVSTVVDAYCQLFDEECNITTNEQGASEYLSSMR